MYRAAYSTIARRTFLLSSVATTSLYFSNIHADVLDKEQKDAKEYALQNEQTILSWQKPGVYAWGSNINHSVAPDSNALCIKTPRRIPFFDNCVLRDLYIDERIGACIDDKGSLLLWGDAFDAKSIDPVKVLKGCNLSHVRISRKNVVALSQSSGKIYVLPFSREEISTSTPEYPSFSSSRSYYFWSPSSSSSSSSTANYKLLQPNTWNSIKSIEVGLDHLLLLDTKGNVYSAALQDEIIYGQLGREGTSTSTIRDIAPVNGLDQIEQIATGNYHSLLLTKKGEVFSFGSNAFGQLCFDFSTVKPFHIIPQRVDLDFYGKSTEVKGVQVAAGGNTSYLVIRRKDEGSSIPLVEVYSAGYGRWGQLGTSNFSQITGKPVRIKAISGLMHFSEQSSRNEAIGVKYLSIGSSHCLAVLNNVTNNKIHKPTFGRDILLWGGSDKYQLGNGKKSNSASPLRLPPLDTNDKTGKVGIYDRLQLAPISDIKYTDKNGRRQSKTVEQIAVAGRSTTAVYSKVVV